MSWTMIIDKAGDNPDQLPRTAIYGDTPLPDDIKVGDTFHIAGQPDDVKWRVAEIIKRR